MITGTDSPLGGGRLRVGLPYAFGCMRAAEVGTGIVAELGAMRISEVGGANPRAPIGG